MTSEEPLDLSHLQAISKPVCRPTCRNCGSRMEDGMRCWYCSKKRREIVGVILVTVVPAMALFAFLVGLMWDSDQFFNIAATALFAFVAAPIAGGVILWKLSRDKT
ncbi:MAG: hypothetical protein K8R88_08035 [Armatimonadetes bacterium]|nr:hypothetical protein [Armatimonadota bacterium]